MLDCGAATCYMPHVGHRTILSLGVERWRAWHLTTVFVLPRLAVRLGLYKVHTWESAVVHPGIGVAEGRTVVVRVGQTPGSTTVNASTALPAALKAAPRALAEHCPVLASPMCSGGKATWQGPHVGTWEWAQHIGAKASAYVSITAGLLGKARRDPHEGIQPGESTQTWRGTFPFWHRPYAIRPPHRRYGGLSACGPRGNVGNLGLMCNLTLLWNGSGSTPSHGHKTPICCLA